MAVVRPRLLVVLSLVLALSVVLAPAALAGGSAGDNQYTDPLAGTHHSGTSSSPAGANTTTSSPTPSSSPATSAPTATVATTTTTTPAATTTSKAAAKTLPFTGYSDWEAGALGALLVVGGLSLRRRVRA